MSEQNWFAVGVDFLIVVIGIFVGLQVTEWNDQREREERSDLFLREIQSDVGLALQTSQRLLVRYKETYDAGVYFLNRLLSDEGITNVTERDLYALRRITYYTVPNIRQGSIALALSPEGASRVRSSTARDALVEFQRAIERSEIVSARIMGRLERIEPVLNKYRALPAGAGEDRDFDVRYDIAAMSESQEFQFAFQNALMVHYNAVQFTRATVEALEELQSRFEVTIESASR